MSTTTVNGGDPAKSIHQNGPKAAFKSNVVTGKTLDNSRKQASPQPDIQNRYVEKIRGARNYKGDTSDIRWRRRPYLHITTEDRHLSPSKFHADQC
jgi:hypothetical protein